MKELRIPDFFKSDKVDRVWRVPYEQRSAEAREWAAQNGIQPSSADEFQTWLMLVDVQNTFCIPEFELYVGGRTGRGAVDDNRRLCEFIYRNLGRITHITATMDTHQAMQIFHAIFLVNEKGEHPSPYTSVSAADAHTGKWKFNPELSTHFGISPEQGQKHLKYYTAMLEENSKYALTVWPYHAMLGGIGHALVSSVEEAVFFHSVARFSQPDFEVKGNHAFTENYSVIGPEVEKGPGGEMLGRRNSRFVDTLKRVDRLVIAGQAKSHCVAWTIAHLLKDLQQSDPGLARKIYLLEDCTSPVVVPGLDYTDEADQAFLEFKRAGMHLVKSSEDFLG